MYAKFPKSWDHACTLCNVELTRVDYEKITAASKRTAIRDLNDLLIKKIVVEISISETDPSKRYRLA